MGFFVFEGWEATGFYNVACQISETTGSSEGSIPFDSGFPIGASAPCWQWFPKAAALPWQEESNETGGFVAHDFARKV